VYVTVEITFNIFAKKQFVWFRQFDCYSSCLIQLWILLK